MASPLNIFRKYQKQVMAVLLLVAIFTFIVGQSLSLYLSSQGRRNPLADKVAVTWSGGKLTEANLRALHDRHNLLINFLEHVAKKAAESGGQPKVSQIDRAMSDEDIVLRLIKARKAEELGLTVSEETMIDYLYRLSDKAIRTDQLNRVLHEAVGERLDEHGMFQQLRTELLAQKLIGLTFGDFYDEYTRVVSRNEQPFPVPPTLAWDYFQRMHRRVRAEVYPLPVSGFVAQVKDTPTQAQVQDLYDEYKDKFPDPYSPDPGFRKYNKVAFQYVKADFSNLLTEEKAKVTDEQIKEYYEKNRDTSYRTPELPDEKILDKKPADKKTGEKKPEDKTPGDETPGDKTPPDDDSNDKGADAKKPPEKDPQNKKSDDPPAPGKNTDENPGAKNSTEPKLPGDSEPKKPAAQPKACDDEPAQTEPGKADPAISDPAKTDAAKTDEPKTDKPKTGDPKAADPKASDPKADDPPDVAPKAPVDPAKTPDKTDKVPAKATKKAPRYRPLDDKLKEEIRGLIARPLAQDRLDKAAKQVRSTVGTYGSELSRWEATSKIPGLKEEDKEPKPEPFVLKELARGVGMEWGETPLVDSLEIAADAKRSSPKYDLSKSGTFNPRNFSWVDFASLAFGPRQPLFKVLQLGGQGMMSGEDVRYFVWRTEEKPAYVPKLEDCKSEVVEAWKSREALKLARDAAQKLAESVNKGGSSLKEGLSGEEADKAHETESFSWRSRNTAMGAEGRLGISRIKKAGPADEHATEGDDEVVEAPGEDFMEAVFALKKGESGVAVNHPQSIVYVVRIVDEPISEELLVQMFLNSPNKMDLYILALSDRQQQINDWQQELEKEMKVKWHRESSDAEEM